MTANAPLAIAYPHGGRNANTLKVAKANQLKLGFTTEEKLCYNTSNPLELPRINAENCGGRKLGERIEKIF